MMIKDILGKSVVLMAIYPFLGEGIDLITGWETSTFGEHFVQGIGLAFGYYFGASDERKNNVQPRD